MTIARRACCRLAVAFALVIGVPPAVAQDKVGVNTAVNPQANGTPPGGIKRQLVIGQDVIFNEHISTDASGQTEIQFLDQSSMSAGPNSDFTIDKFIYDPNTSSGGATMSVARGVFRYVGGKVSKMEGGVTVQTPSVTIVIRGGEVLASVDAGGGTNVVMIYGKKLTVTGRSGCTQELSRVGYAISVGRPGDCPSAPHPVPSGAIAGYLAQLDGRAGVSGGAKTVPTDEAVAASGVPATVSGDLAASLEAAAQSRPLSGKPPVINVGTLQTSFQQSIARGQTAIATATPTIQGTTPSTPGTTPTTPRPVTPGSVTFSASAAAVNSLGPHTGLSFGTIGYPSSALQNGTFSVTVANVVQANPSLTLHDGRSLSAVPNIGAIIAGFSGGAVLSPLTAGATNAPVTLTAAGSYNGPSLPITGGPGTGISVNLGTVASGMATVSPDGQFFTANLVLNGSGLDEVTSLNKSRIAPEVPGTTAFLFGGVPTVTLPTGSIGSYSGTAAGSVFNNGANYTATGTFFETYNFATQVGTVSIPNFDGANYTAGINGLGNKFSGNLIGPAGRSGPLSGGFFGPSAAEVGGTFNVSSSFGPRYIAAGIFTGH